MSESCCPLCGSPFLPDDVVLVPENRMVIRNGDQAHLAPKEWEVFFKLHSAKGRVISKQALLDYLYQLENDEPFANIISVFVCRIRTALKPLGIKITSYKGHGYALEIEGRSRVVSVAA